MCTVLVGRNCPFPPDWLSHAQNLFEVWFHKGIPEGFRAMSIRRPVIHRSLIVRSQSPSIFKVVNRVQKPPEEALSFLAWPSPLTHLGRKSLEGF